MAWKPGLAGRKAFEPTAYQRNTVKANASRARSVAQPSCWGNPSKVGELLGASHDCAPGDCFPDFQASKYLIVVSSRVGSSFQSP
jgi:hypothetical protein